MLSSIQISLNMIQAVGSVIVDEALVKIYHRRTHPTWISKQFGLLCLMVSLASMPFSIQTSLNMIQAVGRVLVDDEIVQE